MNKDQLMQKLWRLIQIDESKKPHEKQDIENVKKESSIERQLNRMKENGGDTRGKNPSGFPTYFSLIVGFILDFLIVKIIPIDGFFMNVSWFILLYFVCFQVLFSATQKISDKKWEEYKRTHPYMFPEPYTEQDLKKARQETAKTESILQNIRNQFKKEAYFLPSEYQNIYAVTNMYNYLYHGRADTLKECLNLYAQESHYETIRQQNEERFQMHEQKYNQALNSIDGLEKQNKEIQRQNKEAIKSNEELKKEVEYLEDRIRWRD